MRNRTLKLLEGAKIKFAGVMSGVFGVSGMLMLKALAAGTTTPVAMAGLAKGGCGASTTGSSCAQGASPSTSAFCSACTSAASKGIGRDLAEVEAASIQPSAVRGEQHCW